MNHYVNYKIDRNFTDMKRIIQFLALLLVTAFLVSACDIANILNEEQVSTEGIASIQIPYYSAESFRDTVSEAGYAGSAFEGDEFTVIQIHDIDLLISIFFFTYTDSNRAYNEVVEEYNKYYQGIIDNYYDGSIYYNEDDNQSYVVMDLKPTNPYREIHTSDFGCYPKYGVICHNNDMLVSVDSIADTEESKNRVNEILELLGFPSPEMIPQDIVISEDFEPLPIITSETSETEEVLYVFDDVVTPMDIDLSFDDVMELLNEWAGMDMSYYPDDYYDQKYIDYNTHHIYYEPDFQTYIQQEMLPDDCGIVWYQPSDVDYHIVRELSFDDFIITEYTDSEWAEIAYRIRTNVSNEYQTSTETTDSLFEEGYCFERIENTNNDGIEFYANYYFGNCIMCYRFNWGSDYRPEYRRFLEMCDILGLPTSENISNNILETNEDSLNIYDKIEIVREELLGLISSQEYLALDQEQRAQLMFDTIQNISNNRYANHPYALFDSRDTTMNYDDTEEAYHIGILLEDRYGGSWVYFRVADDSGNLFVLDRQECYNLLNE